MCQRLLSSLVLFLVFVLASIAAACSGKSDDGVPGSPDEHDASRDARNDADAATAHDAGSAGSAATSSDDLIEAALADGTLDADTALSYRVFAAFGDPRLPAAYASTMQQIGGTRAMGELAARFGELSAVMQAEMRPFFLPPSAAGSWLELRAARKKSGLVSAPLTEDWTPHTAAGGAATVWSQGEADDAIAQSIATALTRTIWPKLFKTLGMLVPLPDTGFAWSGEDGGLDIYLAPIADRGVTHPYLPDGCLATPPTASNCDPCKATPAKILINPSIDALLGTVAHEVMHASQYRYDVKQGCLTKGEYDWWMEATGQWAHDYVYPDTQYEHGFAPILQQHADLPIETGPISRYYGAYLFPFFLGHAHDAKLVSASWAKTVGAGHLEAIEQALAAEGGFKEVWPKFAADLVNEDPKTDFKKWDKISSQVEYEQEMRLSTPLQDQEVMIDAQLAHLSARFMRFQLDTKTLGSLEYEGPSLGSTGHLTALYKVAGKWEEQDWTAAGKRRFCYNKPEEKLEELVLVYSNSEWKNVSAKLKPSPKPKLTAFRAPCTCAGVFGINAFHGTLHVSSNEEGSGMNFTEVKSMSGGDYEFDVVMQSSGFPGMAGRSGAGAVTGSGSIHDRSVSMQPGSSAVIHTLDGDGPINPPGSSNATLTIEPAGPESDTCKYTLGVGFAIDAIDDQGQMQTSTGAVYMSDIELGDFTGSISGARTLPITGSASNAQGMPVPEYYSPGGLTTPILFFLRYGPAEFDLSKPNGSAHVTWTLTATDPPP